LVLEGVFVDPKREASMSVRHLYLVALAGVAACASSARPNAPMFRRGIILNAAEIADAHADITTAYDAVSRLRPNWLAPHGAMSSNTELTQTALVYVDGQQVGTIEALRNIPAYYVDEVRYYDVTQAGARFGIRGGTTGVIEVKMKTP
jgi:hypothetical protein